MTTYLFPLVKDIFLQMRMYCHLFTGEVTMQFFLKIITDFKIYIAQCEKSFKIII